MPSIPRNGKSSAAGASRETSVRHPRRGLQQTPTSSFTSVRTNDSQDFELGLSSRRCETQGQSISSLIDLGESELSLGEPIDLMDTNETPISRQGQQGRGQDGVVGRGLGRPPTPPTADDTSRVFESTKTHYIYQEAHHDLWTSWWEKTPGYREYRAKYGGKRRIRWNSTARGTEMWKYYRQCAVKSGKDLGRPNIECIMCGSILAHPAAVGTSSMHDHHKSIGCKKARQMVAIRDSSALTLEELWSKHGTKVRKSHTP